MNHQQYKDTYLGKFQIEPGMPHAECVWNSKLYSKLVHEIPLGTFGGSAKTGWENKSNTFDPKKWDKILNTPKGLPKQGDMIFWSTGKYWHVAVFDTGDLNSMICISQNSTGANGDVPGDEIMLKKYTYKNCVGWYSPRPQLAVSINGALPEGIVVKIQAYFTKIPSKIKQNSNKIIKPYNQKQNPYCTAYASSGCWTYNHGKTFTDKQIFDWADPILKGKGAQTSVISRKFAEAQGGKQLILSVGESKMNTLLDKGYAVIFSTVCPTDFWNDGILDGKIDGDYVGPYIAGGHAIIGIRVKGKDYLVNSWGDYTLKDKFNTYEVSFEKMLKNKLLRSQCFFIY